MFAARKEPTRLAKSRGAGGLQSLAPANPIVYRPEEPHGMLGIGLSDIPLIVGTVLTLVVLEGLLSADNALVLAVMVRHLPREQQRRALRYGIWGAFGFRFVAVLLSAVLLKFWLFKVVGGLYLLYLAYDHFFSHHQHGGKQQGSRFGSGFWGTVISVELADIAFSIDSIVAAVAMADSLPKRIGTNWKLAVVYIGGILGIIMMRIAAGFFIILLERFYGLAIGAYVLVAWIGLKLVMSGAHSAAVVNQTRYLPWEMNEWIFWGGMIAIIAASLLYKPPTEKKIDTEGLVEVGKAGDRGEVKE
jgi:YkoY family integral membrane protein